MTRARAPVPVAGFLACQACVLATVGLFARDARALLLAFVAFPAASAWALGALIVRMYRDPIRLESAIDEHEDAS